MTAVDTDIEESITETPTHRSPLDEIIQRELRSILDPANENGCFIPITAPTGIGKTHCIKQSIFEELVNGLDGAPEELRTIYYITNSVDNVRQTYEELCQLIQYGASQTKVVMTDNERDCLLQQVLYLPSQDSQLLNADETVIHRLIDRFHLFSDPQIRKTWHSLQTIRQSAQAHPSGSAGLREAMNEKASDLYRLMTHRIQTLLREEGASQLTQTDLRDLDQLVPGDRLRRGAARVCFLTTNKFLVGYQTLKARMHPLRNLSGVLIIIDEIDRQNEVILKHMAQQRAIDLIELTKTLNANLQQNQLEQSARYEGIDELFTALAEDVQSFAQRWQIQYSFNTDGQTLANEKVRLFSDRTVTHAHSSAHILKLRTEPELRKNLIHCVPRDKFADTVQDEPRLSRFINEADWQFRRFLWTMRSAIWCYLNNASNLNKASNTIQLPTFQDAVVSILRHYNLQGLMGEVFNSLDAQVSLTKGPSKKQSRTALRTYHDNGLKLIDVQKNPGTTDTVSCFYTGLAMTPSGLLARMVESGAKIIGISATATVPTVIKNFDQDYLKTRLGSQYVPLTVRQQDQIHQYYCQRRQYGSRSITIQTRFLPTDTSVVQRALERQKGKKVRKPAAVLDGWLNLNSENNGKGGDYVLGWVSKLLQAISHFIDSEKNRYMLVLMNRTINKTKYPEFIEFLQDFIENQAQRSSRVAKAFFGIDAASMRLGEFDEVQSYLSDTNDKVIVFSTYASMGEGKNPQYPVRHQTDKQNLIWAGEGPAPSEIETDIDTLYLEKPTHQLLSDADDPQTDQLLLVHQIMSLQETGWISMEEARRWVHQALRGARSERHLAHYYKTEDYSWVIRKIIEQALGRTARTAFKRPNIDILVDHDLQAILANDPRPLKGRSHEYIALTQTARAGIDQPPADRQDIRRQNLATFYTVDTLSFIKEQLSGFRGAAPETAIENWESIRLQLLKEPTRSTPSGDNPRLYLQSDTTGSYLFSGNLETRPEKTDADRHLRFFEQATGDRWISEAESGLPDLMQNTVVRRHFEVQGFATRWADGKYVMNPAAFFNLYKGALGEEAIKTLLMECGVEIRPLAAEIYETFDFMARLPESECWVAIDAKHWSQDGTAENHTYKAEQLTEVAGIQRFAYINLFCINNAGCRFLNHEFEPNYCSASTVIEVPGLLERTTGNIIQDHLLTLLEWMGGE